MDKLDLIDQKIMYELDLNARISASKLAKRLRKSKETINFRINRLIKKQYIKRFYTVFNISKLGFFYYKLYLKFKNMTPNQEKELLDYISKQGRIAYLASVEGNYDCIILIMVKNSKALDDFLRSFMKLYGEHIQEKEIITFLTTHRLNQRFLYQGKTIKDWCYPILIGDYKLNDIDKNILDIISSNARIPLIEIAKKLNVDSKLVKYRLNKLEKDNIILAYVTSPDFNKLGLQFIQINISLKDPSSRKEIIAYFNSTNKCLFAIELLGRYDLTIEMHIENSNKLKNIIDGFRIRFVDKYNDYDVSTIIKEYVMRFWAPF